MLVGSASYYTDEHSDLLLCIGSRHWDCWVHHSSQEHCWALLGVSQDCWYVVGDADFQTVADTEGVAGTGSAEDTDHGFPGELVLDSSAGNLTGDKHVGECCFQKLALEASFS